MLAVGTEAHRLFPEYLHIQGAHAENFKAALAHLDNRSSIGVVLSDESKAQLEKELLWAFYPIHSGGGIVRNENGAVLMIFRRGKWDLPKGKQDEGEDIATCALREVQEETGLNQISIDYKIGNTMHIYPMGSSLVLKYTAWYMMKGTINEALQPQHEEQIEEVAWVMPQDIRPLLHNSFETISDILIEAKIL